MEFTNVQFVLKLKIYNLQTFIRPSDIKCSFACSNFILFQIIRIVQVYSNYQSNIYDGAFYEKKLFSQKAPSQIFDQDLNTPLNSVIFEVFCFVKFIGKLTITRKKNKKLRNFQQFTEVRVFSSSLLCAITRNHLPFVKIFSNFVHFCPNILPKYFAHFCHIFLSKQFFALFLKNRTHAFTFQNRPWKYIKSFNTRSGFAKVQGESKSF